MRLRRIFSLLGVPCALLLAYACSYLPGIIFAGEERRLFDEHGIMEADVAVLPWEEERRIYGGGAENQLETDLMERVLRTWRESNGEILHEPAAGQLSMEEAFEAGREWISAMGGADCSLFDQLASGQGSGDGDYVSAALSMAAGQGDKESAGEAYYSFWHVRFYNEDANLWLWINAVTGKVWEAELILYAREWNLPEDFAYESLMKFLELSGVENPVAGFAENRYGAVLYLEDAMIYAQMEREDEEWVYVWSEDDGTKKERRSMRISYGLGVIG